MLVRPSALVLAILAVVCHAEEVVLPTVNVDANNLENAETPIDNYVAKRSRTATKTDTKLAEAPQSISVVTAKQIKDQNAQSLSEALRYSAGVVAETYGVDNRGDWVSVRGGSTGSMILDGLRQPLTGWWGSVRDEPFAFERVEVLRGPSSVMYGQNAPGGLVNMVSKRPQAKTSRELTLQYGSFDHKQLSLDMTGALNKDASQQYRLLFLVKDSGTQVDYAQNERIFVAPSLTLIPNDTTILTLYTQYQKDESGNTNAFLPYQGTLLPAPNGMIADSLFLGEPAWDTYGGERIRVGYELDKTLDSEWTLRHHLRYDNSRGHMSTVYAAWWEGFKDANGNANPQGEYLSRDWYAYAPTNIVLNSDIQLEGKFNWGGLQHTLLVAADILSAKSTNPSADGRISDLNVYHPVYGTASEPVIDFGVNNPTYTHQLGVTLQDQIKVNHQWHVVAGLRYDRSRLVVKEAATDSAEDNALTGKLGVVYLAPQGISPYLSYSQSFEVIPGIDINNQIFEPKRGEQIEAGIKWSPTDERFMLSAAVYQLKEKNRPTAAKADPNKQVQIGEVTIDGLEIEGSAKFKQWEMLGNITLTKGGISASDTNNDPLMNTQLESIPKQSAAFWLKHHFAQPVLNGWSAGAGVRHLGKNWAEGEIIQVPAVTLFDALITYETKSWSASLNATNLTDKAYLATCLGRGDCWFGSRQQVTGSLRYKF